MITLFNRPAQSVVLRGDSTVVVRSKETAGSVRLVQTVSPVPVNGATVEFIDGGNF